jgi:hypothetical protein
MGWRNVVGPSRVVAANVVRLHCTLVPGSVCAWSAAVVDGACARARR